MAKKNNAWRFIADFTSRFFIIMLIILVINKGYETISEYGKDKNTSISAVVKEIPSQTIEKFTIEGNEVTVLYKDKTEKKFKKETETSLTDSFTKLGVTPEVMANLTIEVKNRSGFGYYFYESFPFIIPLLFLLVLIWFLRNQMKGGGKAFSFGTSKAKLTDPKDQKIRFDDVAGNENAKQDLIEVVDFLKNSKKYFNLGAQIPKGVLLVGSPGTGKTLLARAVAGEAGVSFFYLSGSEFNEMFVGVGASRVRDLFEQARAKAPAIIFIDEIDAVGRARGVGIGGGNDEREQTLNQILVEMDGFLQNDRVIVLAATNRSDVLDPALLRPGRFDRHVMIDLPDRKDRKAILEVHSKKKPLASDVDLHIVAMRTVGFSGADLESLMNESAIRAARFDKTEIVQNDIIESIDKVLIGPERKSHVHTERERKLTAYHEAGHALVSSLLEYADPIRKISIVPRGYAGGYTLKLPDDDRRMNNKLEFLDDIAMSLGGYAAEELIYGTVSTGPSNDLQVSTKLARDMVTKWGMSDAIGPIALESREGKVLFGEGVNDNKHGDKINVLIDEEVSMIMNTALDRARAILKKHKMVLDEIVLKLLRSENLEQDEYYAILEKNNIAPVNNTDKKPIDVVPDVGM